MRKARTLAEAYNVSGNNLQKITKTIIEEPDITLQEIIDKLHLDCTVPSLSIKTSISLVSKQSPYFQVTANFFASFYKVLNQMTDIFFNLVFFHFAHQVPIRRHIQTFVGNFSDKWN